MGKSILIQYIIWQFIDFPREVLKAWKNFLLFNIEYFSIPFLIRTLFSHWHKYYMSYGKGINLARWFEAFVFNILMSRLLGAIVRTILIIIGILFEIIIFIVGLAVFLICFFSPFILIFAFIYGINLILF
ncbi:MAG: hypothetical protein PHO28_00305 [Candidatus Pacebacteria bacterium]|nr:hypothetical protein [Candidatus Paceibacterota bacterium]